MNKVARAGVVAGSLLWVISGAAQAQTFGSVFGKQVAGKIADNAAKPEFSVFGGPGSGLGGNLCPVGSYCLTAAPVETTADAAAEHLAELLSRPSIGFGAFGR